MPKSMTFSLTHTPVQRIDQRDELGAFGLGGQHAQQPLAGAAVPLIGPGGQGVHEPLELDVGVAQLLGVDEVFGQLPGQPQHHRGHGGRCLLGVEMLRMLAHDAKSQLPQLGFAEQPGIGFDRQQQTVLAQQVAGEGVVGADGRRVVGDVGNSGRRAPGPPPRAGPAGCGPGAAVGRPPCG